MLTPDMPDGRRRAVATRVIALADHADTTLLHAQAYCQAERFPYPTEVAAVPGVLRRFASDLHDGKRPQEPSRHWWRRW